MLECGEITPEEIDALRPLDAMLARWSGPEHSELWARRALFEDPRWRAIRLEAAEVLARLPDEPRESDYMRSLAWEQRGGGGDLPADASGCDTGKRTGRLRPIADIRLTA